MYFTKSFEIAFEIWSLLHQEFSTYCFKFFRHFIKPSQMTYIEIETYDLCERMVAKYINTSIASTA